MVIPVVFAQNLNQQHSETVRKCDQAVKEADMYRHKYQETKHQVERGITDYNIVKGQYKVRVPHSRSLVRKGNALY